MNAAARRLHARQSRRDSLSFWITGTIVTLGFFWGVPWVLLWMAQLLGGAQ